MVLADASRVVDAAAEQLLAEAVNEVRATAARVRVLAARAERESRSPALRGVLGELYGHLSLLEGVLDAA